MLRCARTDLHASTHILSGEAGEEEAPGAANGGRAGVHPRPNGGSLGAVPGLFFQSTALFSHGCSSGRAACLHPARVYHSSRFMWRRSSGGRCATVAIQGWRLPRPRLGRHCRCI